MGQGGKKWDGYLGMIESRKVVVLVVAVAPLLISYILPGLHQPSWVHSDLITVTGQSKPNQKVEEYSWAREQMFPYLDETSGTPPPRIQHMLQWYGCIGMGCGFYFDRIWLRDTELLPRDVPGSNFVSSIASLGSLRLATPLSLSHSMEDNIYLSQKVVVERIMLK